MGTAHKRIKLLPGSFLPQYRRDRTLRFFVHAHPKQDTPLLRYPKNRKAPFSVQLCGKRGCFIAGTAPVYLVGTKKVNDFSKFLSSKHQKGPG